MTPIEGVTLGFGGNFNIMGGPLGINAELVTAADTRGKVCSVSTVCGTVGFGVGISVGATVQAATGTLEPGSVTKQVGVLGAAVPIAGLEVDGAVGFDGSLQIAGTVSGGALIGGGVKLCTQTVNSCLEKKR